MILKFLKRSRVITIEKLIEKLCFVIILQEKAKQNIG